MIPLLWGVLATSLLGSLHCAGMCGGFVCFYAGNGERRRLLPHLAYNGGRLASYLALGAVAGFLGKGLDHLGTLAGIGRGAAMLAGLLMIGWGGWSLLRASGMRLGHGRLARLIRPPLLPALRAVQAQPPVVRGLALGLLTTLIPCGWLYAFAATAAGTGSPLAGALVMGVFWAGTLPVMTSLGLAAQAALGPLRRRVPALTAGLLVMLGALTLAGKFHPGAAVFGAGSAHVCH